MRYLCSLYDLPYQEETKLIKRKIDISIMQKKDRFFYITPLITQLACLIYICIKRWPTQNHKKNSGFP
ncbi:hypothetical protein A8L44_18355 [Bacillus sp. FJAT-27986]|nr:hypothetical protein A8L44_18355 [Bacillus sp. FJAT-27986]